MMASIAAAYAVLGDASARATYDAAVAAAQARASTADQGGAAATVDLDDMQWDGVRREYFSACRCGGRYAVQEAALGAAGSVTLPCTGCSLLLSVEFEEASEGEEEEGG